MTTETRPLGTEHRTRFPSRPGLFSSGKPWVTLGAAIIGVVAGDLRGADSGQSPTPLSVAADPKSPGRRAVEGMDQLSDSDRREFLRAKLALAEKYGGKSKQELDGYRRAIAELDERIAKGPSDAEAFREMLTRFLAFEREQFSRSSAPNQPKWTPELNALLGVLRSITPRGQMFCNVDFTLTSDHAAMAFGSVQLGDLLPYAKAEVARAPIAEQFHKAYLSGLILCAAEPEKNPSEDWLRFFETKSMTREAASFAADLASLKRTMKRRQQPKEPMGESKTNPPAPDALPVRK